MSRKIRKLREAAETARRRDDHEELARLYEQLERAEPSEPEWPKRAADAFARIKQQDQELAALLRAAEAYSRAGFLLKAVAVCKRILRIDPGHTVTQARLAELHSGRKRGLQRVLTEPEKIAARSPHIFPPGTKQAPEPQVVLESTPEPTPAPAPELKRSPQTKQRSAALLSALRRERLNVVGSRPEPARANAPQAQPQPPERPAKAAASALSPAQPPAQVAPRLHVDRAAPCPPERRSIPPGAALQEVTLSDVV
ncbi:MAG: hypothetical protein KC766_21330, partial [Myxococcales bacterium]|nr:hypothetical protein [Myxococcales bacterium]